MESPGEEQDHSQHNEHEPHPEDEGGYDPNMQPGEDEGDLDEEEQMMQQQMLH